MKAGNTSRTSKIKGEILCREGVFYERRIYWGKSYSKTRGRPPLMRQALALQNLLSKVTLEIGPQELIVGRQPKGNPTEAQRKQIDSLLREKGLGERCMERLSKRQRDALACGLYTAGPMTGHMTVDNETILRKGLSGILNDIERSRVLSKGIPDKEIFYEAAGISLQAAIDFAMRYSRYSHSLAMAEPDPERKEELEEISRICAKVPAGPAESFREALQSVWMVALITFFENGENHGCFCPGRLDRYAFRYYKQDLESGRLTKPDAHELIKCFFLKFNEIDPKGTPQVLMIGGTNPDGSDLCNELTLECIRASKDLQVIHPSLAMCYHRGTCDKLLSAAIDLISTGIGFPALFNDDLISTALEEAGAPPEDRVNYIPGSCVEISVIGKSNPWVASGYINIAKCLQLALNRGRCWNTGKIIGKPTPGPVTFRGFEDLFNAFLGQLRYAIRQNVKSINECERVVAELSPFPYLSCLVGDCIKRGRDITAGGAVYNFTEPEGVGETNAADSLAAIKKLVYDEKVLSLQDLISAAKNNFKGASQLRKCLLHSPKFGNDDEYVDSIMVRLVQTFCDEVLKHRNTRGGRYYPGFLCWIMHKVLGEMTPATLDGRREGEPLADCLGPSQGMDVKGPTAMMRSVTKCNLSRCLGGLVLNAKFRTGTITRYGEIFAALVRSYFRQGGFELQVNVVDQEMLRDAQKNPEEHANLMVRVAGYSAYFTTLDKPLQDEIIARTSHVL